MSNLSTWCKCILVSACVLLLASCSRLHEYVIEGPTMGSQYRLVVRASSDLEKESIQRDVARILAGVDQIFSTYRDDSWISQFNRLAVGECLAYPKLEMAPELNAAVFTVLTEAQHWAKLSSGRYDITSKPWSDAWGMHQVGVPVAELSAAQKTTLQAFGTYQYLQFDHERICKIKPLALDTNSLVAGYTVDVLATYFKSQGINEFLLDVTGEVFGVRQREDSKPWFVGLEAPVAGKKQMITLVPLHNLAVSTSGNYRKQELTNNAITTHFYDPKTHKPAQNAILSATVLDKSTMRADALSTLFMVLSLEEGKAFAEQHQLAVMWVIPSKEKGFKPIMTRQFEALTR